MTDEGSPGNSDHTASTSIGASFSDIINHSDPSEHSRGSSGSPPANILLPPTTVDSAHTSTHSAGMRSSSSIATLNNVLFPTSSPKRASIFNMTSRTRKRAEEKFTLSLCVEHPRENGRRGSARPPDGQLLDYVEINSEDVVLLGCYVEDVVLWATWLQRSWLLTPVEATATTWIFTR